MQKTVRRLVSIGAAAVLTATGMTALVATPAAADYNVIDHCYGHRVKTWDLRPSHVGRLELWYSSKSSGTSCVMTYDERKYNGYIFAGIMKVGARSWQAADDGPYEYYAGGAVIKHTKGRCITIGGRVSPADQNMRKVSHIHPRGGKHC